MAAGSRIDIVDVVSLAVITAIGGIVVTQLLGWTGTETIAIVQTLTPYAAIPLVALTLTAMWRGRLLLVTFAVAVGSALAVVGTPLAFPDPQPSPAAGSVGLRVAAANLWYENTRADELDEALADLDADVLVFSEYTPEHEAALSAGPLAADYPYRTGRSGPAATGDAVWSRTPIRVAEAPDTSRGSIEVVVDGPDGDVRIVALHLPTPVIDFQAWRRDLGTVADIGRTATGPTLVIGDLNASWWHPDFRRVLDTGFVDAHQAAGRGFSASWPANRLLPPFVRLDHALTTGGLVSTDIADFEIPGSDHRGLVVTVAPTRRAAP